MTPGLGNLCSILLSYEGSKIQTRLLLVETYLSHTTQVIDSLTR